MAQGAGVSRLAIIACDLLFLRAEEVRAVREAIARLTDVPPDHVVIACSHTHYGPLTEPDRDEQGPQVESYLANLVHLLAGAVAWPAPTSCPAGLVSGRVRSASASTAGSARPTGRSSSVRIRSGPVDPRVAVLRIDGVDGQPLAAVLNYACHPVSLGSKCTDISADFPGTARRLVEEQTGAMCLFLQGATGNINPLLMGWDWTHLARLGLPLGAEAVRVYWSAAPGSEPADGGIAAASSRLHLPPLLPSSIDRRPRDGCHAGEGARAAERGGRRGCAVVGREAVRARAPGIGCVQGGTPVPPVEAELMALRLSDSVGVVTAPGEIFTEIGQSIVARSPFRHTLFAGVCQRHDPIRANTCGLRGRWLRGHPCLPGGA